MQTWHGVLSPWLLFELQSPKSFSNIKNAHKHEAINTPAPIGGSPIKKNPNEEELRTYKKMIIITTKDYICYVPLTSRNKISNWEITH